MAGADSKSGSTESSLKDKGNEFFKAGNYLKAAALYTQAIKKDPSNPTLYSNRAAAFLQLVKLSKALADAETTITLNPQWEKKENCRYIFFTHRSTMAGADSKSGSTESSLKDKGNEFFKAGNYLKAAALYTRAIKKDPSNPTLYSNRAAAFLQLVKLSKALADAETTITLNPQWEKKENCRYIFFTHRSTMAGADSKSGSTESSLKDKGNEFFKAGNYLKAAALYTRAIKKDPSNPTLYSNRAAAFLQLVKLSKALADAETTITLNPQWEKERMHLRSHGTIRRCFSCLPNSFTVVLYNPQSAEVSRKIKRISQLAKDKKRVQELEQMRSNVDMGKHLQTFKSDMSEKCGSEDYVKDMFSFLVETMETAVKTWHETSKVDPRVHFLLDNEKTETEKYAPAVNIDKAFESPETHGNCVSFLRRHAADSFSRAACLVTPKSIISYPQVWKGQGSRKWKHGQNDGFVLQFESPSARKLWFIPSSNEKGQILCRDPEALDVSAHELLPRLFK